MITKSSASSGAAEYVVLGFFMAQRFDSAIILLPFLYFMDFSSPRVLTLISTFIITNPVKKSKVDKELIRVTYYDYL